MQLIKDDEGKPLSSDFYKIAVPSVLITIMLDYVESSRLKNYLSIVLKMPIDHSKVMLCNAQCDGMFVDVPHLLLVICTGLVHLIFESHFEMLSRLGSGGFDMVLKAIASVLHGHVPHSTVYQLTYILVSYCHEQFFHTDNDDSLVGGV
jgi:hypothetical protein